MENIFKNACFPTLHLFLKLCNKATTGLIVILFTLGMMPFYAQAAENSDLPTLINQRLSYMKDVASSKALNHLPVEVLTQEAQVLVDTLKIAASQGIDPVSIKPFIVAQMDAAKAIQYRYRADWLSTPETGWQPRPLNEIRAEIARLSAQIIERLAIELRTNGKISPSDQSEFIARLQQKNLSKADEIQLYKTLLQVRLAKQPLARADVVIAD